MPPRKTAGTALTTPPSDDVETDGTDAGDEQDVVAEFGVSSVPQRAVGGDDKEPDTSVDTRAKTLELADRAEKKGIEPPKQPLTQKLRVVAIRLGFYANERKRVGDEFIMEFKPGPVKLPSWVLLKKDFVPPEEPLQRASDGRHR